MCFDVDRRSMRTEAFCTRNKRAVSATGDAALTFSVYYEQTCRLKNSSDYEAFSDLRD